MPHSLGVRRHLPCAPPPKPSGHEGVPPALDAPTFHHHDMREDLAAVSMLDARVAEKASHTQS